MLKEAIRLAQEVSDHVCLQHALSWLYTLSPIHKVSAHCPCIELNIVLLLSEIADQGSAHEVELK